MLMSWSRVGIEGAKDLGTLTGASTGYSCDQPIDVEEIAGFKIGTGHCRYGLKFEEFEGLG